MKTKHMLGLLTMMTVIGTTTVMGQGRRTNSTPRHDSGRVTVTVEQNRMGGGNRNQGLVRERHSTSYEYNRPVTHRQPVMHREHAVRTYRHEPVRVHEVYVNHPEPMPCPPPRHGGDVAGVVAGAVVGTTLGLLIGSLAY